MMRRLFGPFKLPPVILGIIFGVWAGLVRMASPSSSNSSSPELGLMFTGAALIQLVCAFALLKLHKRRTRELLSIYYAAVMFVGIAVSVGLAFDPGLGPFIGLTMAIGFTAMAFTAFYLLHRWDSIPFAHPDAAVFLGSTHVLALVAVAASAAREWMPCDSGNWMQALTQTTYFSLTALALPISAGIWTRLVIHRPEPPSSPMSTPPTKPTDPASPTSPTDQTAAVKPTVIPEHISARGPRHQTIPVLAFVLTMAGAVLALYNLSRRSRPDDTADNRCCGG